MLRLLAFIAALLVSLPASAVSCGGKQSVKRAYAEAQDVFSAHVEEIYVDAGFGRDDFHFAKLRVLQAWKGSLKPGDIVSTTAEDSIRFVSDGLVPIEGSNVLVYSSGAQPFVLHACSRSATLEGNHDIRELERHSGRARGG